MNEKNKKYDESVVFDYGTGIVKYDLSLTNFSAQSAASSVNNQRRQKMSAEGSNNNPGFAGLQYVPKAKQEQGNNAAPRKEIPNKRTNPGTNDGLIRTDGSVDKVKLLNVITELKRHRK